MTDASLNQKTKAELIAEVETLRQRVADLESIPGSESVYNLAQRQQTNERYVRQLIEESPLPIIVSTATGEVCLLVNQKFTEVFGYTIEDIPGVREWWILAYPDDAYREAIRNEWNARITAAVRDRTHIKPMETRVQCKDGSKRYIEFHFSSIGDRSLIIFVDLTERKRAEDALRRVEQTFSTVFYSSPIGATLSRREDGVRVAVNDAFLEIFGYSRQYMLENPVAASNLWADMGAFQQFQDRMAASDSIQMLEFAFRKQSGETGTALLSVDQVELGDEKYLLSFVLDITERKQAEETLRRVNRAYKVLSECHQAMIRSKDEQSLLDEICHILAETGGYPLAWVGFAENDAEKRVRPAARAGTASGYTDNLYVTWDESDAGMGPSGRAIRSGQPVIITDIGDNPAFAPWKNAAQQYKFNCSMALPLIINDWVMGTLNIYSNEIHTFSQEEFDLLQQLAGNLSFGIAALRVQAERSRITRELEERESLLSAIINSNVDLICRYTPDTVLTFVNDAYCRFIGRSREELIGKSFMPVTLEEERPYILAHIDAVCHRSEPSSHERRVLAAGNTIRWVQWVNQAVRDNHGNLLIQAVGRDITAQKQAEDALVEMNKQLEERVRERTADLQAANEQLQALSRVKDEFVSNVSHELRTPITSLTIREHLLRKNPERLEYHLEVMERETTRLRTTIEDLLQLSRLDQKQTPLNLAPVDLNAMVRRYVSDRSVIAETRNLSLTYLESDNVPGIYADEGLLEQTLGILLTNAMNYTPAGGHITVKSIVQCTESSCWVGFSVSDDGPGISPKDQAHLFERFFRGETGRASGAAGTGLGLAIAKEIIERHKGKIYVESSGIQGEGACFSILLPEQEQPAPTAALDIPPPP